MSHGTYSVLSKNYVFKYNLIKNQSRSFIYGSGYGGDTESNFTASSKVTSNQNLLDIDETKVVVWAWGQGILNQASYQEMGFGSESVFSEINFSNDITYNISEESLYFSKYGRDVYEGSFVFQ